MGQSRVQRRQFQAPQRPWIRLSARLGFFKEPISFAIVIWRGTIYFALSGPSRLFPHWGYQDLRADGDTELASSPGDRLTSRPAQRRLAAAAAAATAATSSATADPAGAGGGGSGSRAHSHMVNTPRTSSARDVNRASQPRTVETGQPSLAAIFRWPVRAELAVRPAQIIAAASARRSRQLTGSSTCVTPQPRHRDRRGRSRQPIPP
jgi:hypothetical protein